MQVKCKFCSNKNDKEQMECVKKGKVNNYYCPKCLIDIKTRDEIINKFYEYTNSLVVISQVYLAINKLKEKKLTYDDILYIMDYVINNKCVLNYPAGLAFYADRAIKQKRELDKIKEQKEKVLKSIFEKPTIIETNNTPKKVDSAFDITNFL